MDMLTDNPPTPKQPHNGGRSSNSNSSSNSSQKRTNRTPQSQSQSHSPHSQESPGDSDEGSRIMCVYEEGGSIAFACFNEIANTITIEEVQAFGYDTEDVIEQFKEHVEMPTLIVVGKRIAGNDTLMSILTQRVDLQQDQALKDAATPNAAANSQSVPSIPYKILNNSGFDSKNSRAIIIEKLKVKDLLVSRASSITSNVALNFPEPRITGASSSSSSSASTATATSYTSSAFPGPPQDHQLDYDNSDAFHSLSTLINFESTTLVRTLGGLLSYLQSTLFRLEESGHIKVISVINAANSKFMKIGSSALKALHIFSEESHPLLATSGACGSSKEGLSIYSLLNRNCSSKMGSRCLKEWMLRPLLDKHEIKLRQDGVELMMLPELSSVVASMGKLFKKAADVSKLIMRMQRCQTSPLDYLSLKHAIDAGLQIISLLTGDTKHAADTNKHTNPGYTAFLNSIIAQTYSSALMKVSDRITLVIDEELTYQTKEICIVEGYDVELDNAKARFDDLDEILSRVASAEVAKNPELVLGRGVRVIFLPQVGFLVSVEKSNRAIPTDYEFYFEEGNDMFFKNEQMRELDDQEGDLDALIKDKEDMIAAELEEEILQFDLELRNSFDSLAQFDVIMSFAALAFESTFSRPEVVDSSYNTILIENGRHPLQELLTSHRYITNDTLITSTSLIALITGPNFSGKSCYMRQVGVLVYLAHLGSFLPCGRSQISVTDRIEARISCVETCAVPQSAFQIDLCAMATILRQSTKNSLVLIDEFGKGTAPESGMSVLAASIDFLSSLRCKVVCTTHFLELFGRLNLLKDGRGSVKTFRMSIHIPDNDNDSGNEMEDAVPLFKLEEGVARSSDGLLCAKMAGVKQEVLVRGKEVLQALQNGKVIKALQKGGPTEKAKSIAKAKLLKKFVSHANWRKAKDEDVAELKRLIAEFLHPRGHGHGHGHEQAAREVEEIEILE